MDSTHGSGIPPVEHAGEHPEFPQLVQELRSDLGASLVAYIAGANETRTVRIWAESSPFAFHPDDAVEQRLRLAHTVLVIVRAHFDAQTVASWFQGMNPTLSDHAPAWIIRERPVTEAEPLVLTAARTFLAEG